MMHPTIARAHELIRQVEDSERRCAERCHLTAEGAQEYIDECQRRRDEEKTIEDDRKRQTDPIVALAHKAPGKWPATMVTK